MSELVTKHCPVCFIDYAIPRSMQDAKLADGGNWFCPNGHSLRFTESKLDKMQRERDQLKQETARLQELADLQRTWRKEAEESRQAAERRASAARGQVTRLKNRAAAGVCPCCNRTFAQLQRHMAAKHPTFTAEEVAPKDATLQ